MKILVTASTQSKNGIGGNPSISRVTTFKENEGELERITMSLKVPFFVLELKEKLQREQFIEFLNRLRNIEVSQVLDAEAIKMIKKKNNSDYADIVNMIVQVG